MAGIVVVLVVVGVLLLVVVALSLRARGLAKEWASLAQELGLRLEPGEGALMPSPGRLTGSYQGYEVEVDYGEGLVAQRMRGQAAARNRIRTSDGDKQKRYAVTTFFRPELPAGLRVTRDLGKIPSMLLGLGSQDIEMGDAAFDAAFQVRGHDENEVRRLLSPTAREAMMAFAGGGRMGLWITTQSVSVLSDRGLRGADVKALLDDQHAVADALCKRYAEMLLEDSRTP